MAQAVKFMDVIIGICATKTGQELADLRAMLQDATESGYDSYIVVDYWGPTGVYVHWSQMRELFFRNYFTFPWGENPNRFEAVVALETNPED